MSRKILFFINPVSGTKNKHRLQEKIVRQCGEKNISFEILFTSKDGNYDFLHDKVVNELITDIAIAGGDGSIAPVVAAVLDLPVNIGIIPVGSGNGLAWTARIPKSADRAIDTILAGNANDTDVFLINNQLGTHVCGLGFDAKVAHDFAAGKSRGLFAYTKIAISNFRSAHTYPFTIEANGSNFKVDAFLICIANSNQFGNNFKVAPKASICDGLLDIVVVKKTNKPQAVVSFILQIISGEIKSLTAKDFHKKNILYFQTKSIKIENPQLAPLHIDGDPAQTGKELVVEILPSAYRLICP